MAAEADDRLEALEQEHERLKARVRRIEARTFAEGITVSNTKGDKKVLRLASDGESVEVE